MRRGLAVSDQTSAQWTLNKGGGVHLQGHEPVPDDQAYLHADSEDVDDIGLASERLDHDRPRTKPRQLWKIGQRSERRSHAACPSAHLDLELERAIKWAREAVVLAGEDLGDFGFQLRVPRCVRVDTLFRVVLRVEAHVWVPKAFHRLVVRPDGA
jgi:hypothetical protein